MKKIKKRKKHQSWCFFVKMSIILILLFIVGRNVSVVDAGMNDSVITRNRVENVYAVASVDGREHLYYLNMYEMNGRVAYCIELGKDITTDIYHSTLDFSIMSLSEEQMRYIRALAYYGYQYPGHTSHYYYMATQELIWEYLSNYTIDVKWTNELDVNGKRIEINQYLSQVSTLRSINDNDLNFVDLDGNVWENGRIYSINDKIVLRDVSNLIYNYEIISNGHAEVDIVGNTLVIQLDDKYIGTETIKLKRKSRYDYSSMLYYYDSSQKLISNGNYDDFETEISFYVKGSNLSGQVVDSDTGENISQGDALLEGAIYELYNEDKDLIGTYETDSNGQFLVDNLGYGTYFIKQVKASDGYLLNEKEIVFDFNENNTLVKLEQEVISNVIEIKKYYEIDDGNYKPEKNIHFNILDSNGNLYQEIITSSEGEASIAVPYGIYTVKQVNTMNGYDMVADFEVIAKEEDGKILHYNLVNALIKSKIKVISYDKDSENKLVMEGFSYRIRKHDDDNYFEINGKDIYFSDEYGELIFPMMFSYGDYVLEIVDVPKGILILKNKVEFSISDDTNFEMDGNMFVVPVNVYYSFIMGNIDVFTKREVFYSELNDYGYKKIKRENILVSLFANDDILRNGEIIYQKGDMVYDGFTNNEGILSIDNLYLGDYCLFDNDIDKKQCFVLDANSSDELLVKAEFEFTKELNKGNIQIKNFSVGGDIITGSVFEIYDHNDKKIYSGVTNDYGLLKVNNLLSGNYCILQKKVLNGYQLIKDEQCILLKGDMSVDFINKSQNKKVIYVPNTFSNSNDWIKILLIFVIGIGVFIYKKVIFNSNMH